MAEKKLTVKNIDREIKKRTNNKDWKGTKEQIQAEQEYIERIKKQNAHIRYQSKKLKQEQVRKSTPKERVREIDQQLKSLKTISLKGEQNYLNMLKGKDFYHIVDNGFKTYKIKNSQLVKDKNIGLTLTEQLIEDIAEAEKEIKDKLKNKKLDKAYRRKLKYSLKGIDKLRKIADKNHEALENKDFKDLTGDKGSERYLLLSLIQGENIRINA